MPKFSPLLFAIGVVFAIASPSFAETPAPKWSADLQPVALRFANVMTPSLEPKIHQIAWLEFTNVGNQPMEPTDYVECRKLQYPKGGISLAIACIPPKIEVLINQQRLTYPLYQNPQSESEPPYLPGETYRWQFELPNNTLQPGQTVSVQIDANQRVGQWSAEPEGDVYTNDTITLRAQRIPLQR